MSDSISRAIRKPTRIGECKEWRKEKKLELEHICLEAPESIIQELGEILGISEEATWEAKKIPAELTLV